MSRLYHPAQVTVGGQLQSLPVRPQLDPTESSLQTHAPQPAETVTVPSAYNHTCTSLLPEHYGHQHSLLRHETVTVPSAYNHTRTL